MNETRRIGSDYVIVQPDCVIVISRANMDLWRVGSYRPTLIRFVERDWRVAETRAVPPDSTQYTLVPWNLSETDVVGHTVEYGLAFVTARDGTAQQSRRVRRVSGLLRVVAPLTGFLSGRIKDWLEVTYGIDSVATTKQSVIIQFIGTTAVFGTILLIAAVTHLPPFVLLFIALLFLVDAGVRWDQVLDERRPPAGLFEWVLTFRRR